MLEVDIQARYRGKNSFLYKQSCLYNLYMLVTQILTFKFDETLRIPKFTIIGTKHGWNKYNNFEHKSCLSLLKQVFALYSTPYFIEIRVCSDPYRPEEGAYSFMAPDPTSNFGRSPCLLWSCFVFFRWTLIKNTVCYRHISRYNVKIYKKKYSFYYLSIF